MLFNLPVKSVAFLPLLAIICCCFTATAQDTTIKRKQKRINIVVSSKVRYIDWATYSFQLQTHLNRLFHRKKFYFLIVSSLEEASERISRIAEKENAVIGNLWFDSHGHYARRISLIEVGNTEINYNTILDPTIDKELKRIARYCNQQTIVGLGSCYSGATFIVPAVDKFPEQYMNGDSLMMRMSAALNGVTVLGTRSWVMSKPGIFSNEFAFSGNPLKKRFQDTNLLPAWKDMGEWVSFSTAEGKFSPVRSVSLDRQANILSNYKSYLAVENHHLKQMKYISRLKKGNFDVKYFYKYEFPMNSRENHMTKAKKASPNIERSAGE